MAPGKLNKTIRRLLLSPVNFQSDKIRPDGLQSDALGHAIQEMTACKVIFDGWVGNLDQYDQ